MMAARTLTRPPTLSGEPGVGTIPWKSHLFHDLQGEGFRVDVMQSFLMMESVGDRQTSEGSLLQWLLFYLPQAFGRSPAQLQRAQPSPFLSGNLLPALPGSRSLSQRRWVYHQGLNPTYLLAQGPLVNLFEGQFPYLFT